MATILPSVRQPFGELSSSRVQQLSSAKNRQNGFTSKSSPLSGKPITAPIKTPGKRSFTPSTYDDADAENVDPGLFSPSKKSKGDTYGTPVKPFTFTLKPSASMPPPSARLATPLRASMSTPRAPLTAPAGRSPKRKIASNRRISAPFTRIDPPFSGNAGSTLPFSLDAALKGTLPASCPAGATIRERKPSSFFFEIYEDTPEEEAAILMEHSTLTLDLSSDDEAKLAARSDRGKENTPPEGYDAPAASRTVSSSPFETATAPALVKKTDLIRRKIAEMDDGERSPLSDLETEPFIPDGLDQHSHVVVDGVTEKSKLRVEDLFATTPRSSIAGIDKSTVPSTASVKKSSPKLDVEAGDSITIFVDSEESDLPSSVIVDNGGMLAEKAELEVALD